MHFALSTPFPLGVDGYFYPVQLRSLLADGHLHWPAAPLTFYLFAPLAYLFGPVVAVKVGASLATSLLVNRTT